MSDLNSIYEDLGGLKADATTAQNQRANLFEKVEDQGKEMRLLHQETLDCINTAVGGISKRVGALETKNNTIKNTLIGVSIGSTGIGATLATQWKAIMSVFGGS